jgi:hypothetical protein
MLVVNAPEVVGSGKALSRHDIQECRMGLANSCLLYDAADAHDVINNTSTFLAMVPPLANVIPILAYHSGA